MHIGSPNSEVPSRGVMIQQDNGNGDFSKLIALGGLKCL